MPLQRETVARAALRLVDEVGLDGLTIRRLAAYLNIQNPSLYWHFKNKQELLNCMAELILADFFAELHEPEPDQDWADWLTIYARRLRDMMLAHRDGARIVAEADPSRSAFFEGFEWVLNVLRHAGFDGNEAAIGVITLQNYVLGNVFEIQAHPFSLASDEDEQHRSALRLSFDEEHFPNVAAFLRTPALYSSAWASTQFETGLSLFLDGLRTHFAQKHSNGTS
ncbi:TetR family transcriptional regulator [Reticulibacter mediterranei]|uniref:TetR family transcriptional regulator n=1 Tax=Reticulibacter mediterranei TaxID=2778369 RepID=A0A8J3N8K3_9CHLR|nr:TetR/AcrR family transcriptional regulator C-terminal domain-containing protein [Reticulibacter mediterranei]GHO98342.1 TetR family transcriptional regulator [Reticulibacter mediterranei]